MSEAYSGVKFRTVFKGRDPLDLDPIPELAGWCRKLAEAGLAPSGSDWAAGNLSFRHGDGFVITAAGANLKDIQEGEFTEVLEADPLGPGVVARGPQEPSSESLMHGSIYVRRPDVKAVFHGHDALILRYGKQLGLPTTDRVQPYGTPALAEEVGQMLAQHKFLIIREHGFLALGATMEVAGREALRWHEEAQRIAESALE
jgi:ribulose-5-phosphate 4-epimerase/fuculose-1-phosphate aldolase